MFFVIYQYAYYERGHEMKLTLEQILEEHFDKNFIVINNKLRGDKLPFSLMLFVKKPDIKFDNWGNDEESPRFIIISPSLIDYSGDWRDSLRSREDIKPGFVEMKTVKNYGWGFCKKCQSAIDKESNFCKNCGIKLNWVE